MFLILLTTYKINKKGTFNFDVQHQMFQIHLILIARFLVKFFQLNIAFQESI